MGGIRWCWHNTATARAKASAEEITKALAGNRREEHLFVLRQALAM